MHATAIAVSTRFTCFFVKLRVKPSQIRHKVLRAKNYAMATVCAKVFKHHQKTDGTYNVKIRVFHKNERKWIDTIHFVTDKQLSKKMDIHYDSKDIKNLHLNSMFIIFNCSRFVNAGKK